MTTQLSADAFDAALAESTEEVFLVCLTFTHPSLETPIRLVNDKQDLQRTAGTFTAFPFTFQDAPQGDDGVAQGVITVDNVDQRITAALRGIAGRPEVSYEVVLRSAPNVVQRGPIAFVIPGFSVNVNTITLRIAVGWSLIGDAFPKDVFSPSNARIA